MPSQRLFPALLLNFLLTVASFAQSTPQGRTVSLSASDGTVLKATYFSTAIPGPGVLLLHQCNQQRKSWDVLAGLLVARGIHVLALDYRGFGESGGAPYDKLTPQEQQKVAADLWPGDIDLAFQFLVSQDGVTSTVIGAGGASCGVNNSIQLARRHPEVKALVLLSGGTNREGRLFLQSSKDLPVFTAAADDDVFGGVADTMQWLFSVSANPASRFERYSNGGHGSEMFAAHKELPDTIAQWFGATLMNKPASLPVTNGKRLPSEMLQTVQKLDRPDGAAEGWKTLSKARERDPKAEVFPEFIVNLLGYEQLQAGDVKGAIKILQLNVAAYPDSPNVYDSLGDAYLADGQKQVALKNAKIALRLLANDTVDTEARRKAIRESAQQKIRQLGSPGR